MSDSGPSLVVRGSNGMCLQAPPDFNIHQGFSPDTSKSVKVFSWSRDGKSLAWSNMSSVKVARLSQGQWSVVHEIPQPKVNTLALNFLLPISIGHNHSSIFFP